MHTRCSTLCQAAQRPRGTSLRRRAPRPPAASPHLAGVRAGGSPPRPSSGQQAVPETGPRRRGRRRDAQRAAPGYGDATATPSVRWRGVPGSTRWGALDPGLPPTQTCRKITPRLEGRSFRAQGSARRLLVARRRVEGSSPQPSTKGVRRDARTRSARPLAWGSHGATPPLPTLSQHRDLVALRTATAALRSTNGPGAPSVAARQYCGSKASTQERNQQRRVPLLG
jgi:hypothetical protein